MRLSYRYYILIVVFQAYCLALSAQSYTLLDTTLANKLANSALINLNAGSNQSKIANSNIQKAIDIYEILFGRDFNKLAELYFIKYQTTDFLDFKEKEASLENSIRITKLKFGEKNKRLRKLINNKGYILGCKAEYKNALNYLKQYTGLFDGEAENDFDDYESTFQSIAIYHQTLKEPDSAIIYYNKALEILNRSVNSKIYKPGLEKILKNSIAQNYLQKGEFLKYDSLYVRVESMMSSNLFNQIDLKDTSRLLEKYLFLADKSIDNEDYSAAIEYLNYYLDLLQAYKPSLKKATAKELNKLGEIYLKINRFNDAYEKFEKASLIIFENLKNDKIFYAKCLEKMAYCKLQLHEYNTSESILTQAVRAKKEIDSTGIELVNTYLKLAEVLELNGELEQAERYYLKSLSISESKINLEFQNKTFAVYAEFLTKQKRYEEALSTIMQSLKLCHVSGSTIADKMLFLPISIKNLDLFAKIQSELKLQNADSIVGIYEKMLELIYLERNRNYNNIGAITPLMNFKPAFEHAISFVLDINSEKGKIKNIEKAFSYCEKNKFLKLEEGIKKNKALRFAGVPDSIIHKEKHFAESISKINKMIFESETNAIASNANYLANLMISEGQLNHQNKIFKKELESQYPKYYKLKNSNGKIDIKVLQNCILKDDSALLSYFMGDSNIVVFLVKADTIIYRQVRNDFDLKTLVKTMLTSTTGFQTNPEMTLKFDSLSIAFTQASHTLFEKLVEPVYNLLPQNVTIIPDEVIGYIPFEALLVEKPQNPTRFNRFHYLLNDHIISYAYSASTWLEMRNQSNSEKSKQSITAFAPFYKGVAVDLEQVVAYRDVIRKELNPLPYSGEEALKISEIFNGDCFLGNTGTKQFFLDNSKTSRILHIATHAQANDKMGDYCFLVFSGKTDSVSNEILYASEIYNLDLSSDLVTLSACETGLGQLKGGEGIISLSRAFAYAGAKSIVTSLWQVSDSKTKDLMISFYRNLHNGMRKDEALW